MEQLITTQYVTPLRTPSSKTCSCSKPE